MLPFGVTIPATVPQRSEIPEGLKNYPIFKIGRIHERDYEDRGAEVWSGMVAIYRLFGKTYCFHLTLQDSNIGFFRNVSRKQPAHTSQTTVPFTVFPLLVRVSFAEYSLWNFMRLYH